MSRLPPRTLARRAALQWLYQCDAGGDADPATRAAFLDRERTGPAARAFAETLIDGTLAARDALDAVLAPLATNWSLDRMTTVDRNILRLAAWELLHHAATPAKVVLNEAIELAKQFGTEHSGRFVNGILNRLLPKARAARGESEPEVVA